MRTRSVPFRGLGGLSVAAVALALGACSPAVDDEEEEEEEPADGGGPVRMGGRGGSGGTGGSAGTGAGGAGGSPAGGAAGRSDAGAPAADGPPPTNPPPGQTVPYTPPRVVISEIMYHPVRENAAEEQHEFLELHNRTDAAVALAGWRFGAGVAFTFPAGASLPARGYVVVAKDPDKVAALYKLDRARVFGPYMGELDNGGERIVLQDERGMTVDELRYDDKFPWPMGADALGAGPDWLTAAGLPISRQQYMGRSLERISYEISGSEPVNWAASPVDMPSPGAKNSAEGTPRAIADALEIFPEADPQRGSNIGPEDRVVVRVRFSARGMVTAPQVELFVDDVERTNEMVEKFPMRSGANGWEAVLPPRPANSIVRYRIGGNRGMGEEVIAPREGDPYKHYMYFVAPKINSQSPVYHLFVSKANWNKMFENIRNGRPLNCADDKRAWNARVPGVFVTNGVALDIMLRYQGSKFNRGNGSVIREDGAGLQIWPLDARPAPMNTGRWTSGGPFKALSLRLYMPRYQSIDGKSDIILNKMVQACQAFATFAGGLLMESVGVPSSRVWYRRVYVNGRYYHYMAEYERVGEELLTRFFGRNEPIGDLFKSVGNLGDEGAYGWGDARLLPPLGGYSTTQRMSCTYQRKAPDWKDDAGLPAEEVIALSREFEAAGGQRGATVNTAAMRQFFEKNFDMKALTSYVAAINWMFPWDDFFQNHFLYRKADGKWMIFPWDFDLLMGRWSWPAGTRGAEASFHVGEVGNRSNRENWVNLLKDAFIKVYRPQLHERIKQLAANEFTAQNVARFADMAFAAFKLEDAREQPSRGSSGQATIETACGGPAALRDQIKRFATDRNARVAAGMFD